MRFLFTQRGPGVLHVWLGPLGLHLYWPDVWKSHPDFERRWREQEPA